MSKEPLSSCCNAAVLELKESDETVCLACYHTTAVQEHFFEKGLELDVRRDRVELHGIVGHLIFLSVLIRIIDLILFLF